MLLLMFLFPTPLQVNLQKKKITDTISSKVPIHQVTLIP